MIDLPADQTMDQAPDSGQAPDTVQAASDELLLLGARLRDEVALTVLYDRYGGLIFTLASRVVGDRALAEEITQDVFLRIWHGREQYDTVHGTTAAWLLGIARDLALEVKRGRQNASGPATSEPPAQDATVEHGAPASPDEIALRTAVRQAFSRLPVRQRTALELTFYSGLTAADIAREFDESIETIEVNVRDGVRRFTSLLTPELDGDPRREADAS
jgi:RNA polymerase sigma-70 factor (ECF subfamily)